MIETGRKLRLYRAQRLWPSCGINKTLLAIFFFQRGGTVQHVQLCLPVSVETALNNKQQIE